MAHKRQMNKKGLTLNNPVNPPSAARAESSDGDQLLSAPPDVRFESELSLSKAHNSASSDFDQRDASDHQNDRPPSSSFGAHTGMHMAQANPLPTEQSGRSTSARFDSVWDDPATRRLRPEVYGGGTAHKNKNFKGLTLSNLPGSARAEESSDDHAGADQLLSAPPHVGFESEGDSGPYQELSLPKAHNSALKSAPLGCVGFEREGDFGPYQELSLPKAQNWAPKSAPPDVQGFESEGDFGPYQESSRSKAKNDHSSSYSRNSHAELMRLFRSAQVDASKGAIIYALMKEMLVAPLTAHRLSIQRQKLMEIIIQLGDNVHVDELSPGADHGQAPAERPILYLETSIIEDCQPLLLRASDLQIAAGDDGDTLLHLVALHGNAQALERLHRAFFSQSGTDDPESADSHFIPNLDPRNKDGRTPLHYASGKKNDQMVFKLVRYGADMYAQDEYGAIPFHFAARSGNIANLDLLLKLELEQKTSLVEKDTQVNTKATRTGLTALHYAAWNGHSEAVEWLLSHGASPDVADTIEGNTPLHWAASRKECPADVIDSLIVGGGANAQIQNKDGYWPIGLADKSGHHELARAIVSAIRRSAAIRMGFHRTIKTALITEQQRSNGATLFHFFAAYGTEEELEWLLGLLLERTYNVNGIDAPEAAGQKSELSKRRDNFGRSVAHWAAWLANKDALGVLAKHNIELNTGLEASQPHRTPLAAAVLEGNMEFATELLKFKPMTEEWLGDNCNKWLEDYYNRTKMYDDNFERAFVDLQDGFERHCRHNLMKGKKPFKKSLFLELPPIFLALYADRADIAVFLRRHCTAAGVEDAVNASRGGMGWTALHWATFLEQRKILSTLCRSPDFAPFLTANVEDMAGRTALQYAKHMELGDMENELMQRKDVKAYVDGMYSDRQLYVDAVNAILVGAALIASVTFAGWLQPPLSYTPYYNLPQLPYPSPPDTFQSYAAIQQNLGVRCFWVFNSLSFTMAICTMVAGLVGVAPTRGAFIAIAVRHLRHCLVIASMSLGVSIGFVFAAFAAAGFAVLPPIFQYQANMMATIVVGGVPCLVLLTWFAGRLWSFRAKGLIRKLLAKIFPPALSPDAGFERSTKATQPPPPPPDSGWYRDFGEGEKRSKDHKVGPRYATQPWDDGLDSRTHGELDS